MILVVRKKTTILFQEHFGNEKVYYVVGVGASVLNRNLMD